MPKPALTASPRIRSVLSEIAELSCSDLVVLRSVLSETQQLELIDHGLGKNPPMLSQVEIPSFKSFEGWGTDDPSRTWGFCSTEAGVGCSSGYFSDSEKALIEWVRHKAWFPLDVDGEPVVLVLLRGSDTPYTWDEVLSAWLFSQLTFSCGHQSNASHERFVSALTCLDQLHEATAVDRQHIVQAILHLLSSSAGFQWNRVWAFDVKRFESEIIATCIGAIGETSVASWSRAIRNIRPQTAKEELVDFFVQHGYRGDGLFQVCVESQLRFRIPATLITAHPSESSNPIVFNTLCRTSPQLAQLVAGEILRHVRLPASNFQPNTNLYSIHVFDHDSELVYFFEQTYSDTEQENLLLTSLFVQHASRLLIDHTTYRVSEPAITEQQSEYMLEMRRQLEELEEDA